MNAKAAAVLLSGVLAACTPTQPPQAAAPPAPSPPPAEAAAPAPPAAAPTPVNHVVNIRQAGCEGLLKLSPEDRSAASMFYIGYEASRSRSSTINVGSIPSIAGQAFTYCQENPGEPPPRRLPTPMRAAPDEVGQGI